MRKTLVAFERVGSIEPSGTVDVSFTFDSEALSLHNVDGKLNLFDGMYDLIVGIDDSDKGLAFPITCSDGSGCKV